jgi:dTDP-L-rhamnose 4-epimerase
VHQSGERPAWLEQEVELVRGDIRDKDAITRALSGVDGIVHLAAYQDYLLDFSTFFHVNTAGTALLYEVVVEKRLPIKKIVIGSSQAAYGEGKHKCQEHGTLYPDIRFDDQLVAGKWDLYCPSCGLKTTWQPTDESVTKPQNQYGLSKLAAEMVAFSLGRRYQIPTTALRYSITQGRWQSPFNAYSGICRIFTIRALAGMPALVFEDGNQVRDYVYVEDVARANMLALNDPRTDFEAYNVGGQNQLSTLEYAQIVSDVVRPGLVPELPGFYRFGDTRHMVSDSTKLKELGWCNSKSVAETVAEYAAWIEEIGLSNSATDADIRRMLDLGVIRRSRTK